MNRTSTIIADATERVFFKHCKIVEGYIPIGSRYGRQCDINGIETNHTICSRIIILNL